MATLEESTTLAQQMYVAYYGRPADQAGLDFWAAEFAASDDLDAALTAFGDSAEYTAAFEFFNNTGLITNLYRQMFNHDPDAEGLAFYLDRLDTGVATLASIAKQIADGASGTDMTALDNKVAVAGDFTDAVTAGNATYAGAADIASAQAILDTVSDDAATVTAAAAEITTFVDDSDPAVPFSLTAGLATLSAANAALAAFQVDNADTAGDLLTAQGTYNGEVGGASAIATDSAVLAAAYLSDAEGANSTALIAANEALATAEAAVAAVTGLAEAVANKAVTAAAVISTTTAAAQAVIDLNAEEATYALNAPTALDVDAIPDTATTTVSMTNAPTYDLIVTVNGALVLNPDPAGDESVAAIAEADYPGITALMAAVAANNAAITAAANAGTADTAADDLIIRLDIDNAATATALAAVGAAMTQVTPVDADTPTATETADEATALLAGIDSLKGDINALVATGKTDAAVIAEHNALTAAAVAAGYMTTAQKATVDGLFAAEDADAVDGDTTDDLEDTNMAAAQAASVGSIGDETTGNENTASDFTDLVDAYDTAEAVDATPNPLTTPLTGLEGDVTTAEDAISDLADAVTAIATTAALVAEEDALDAVIAAAVAEFTDAELTAPVTIDGNETATSGGDIFVANDVTADITNFGLLGDDTLYVGVDHTFNDGVYATDGDDAVLEIFIVQNGGDVDITIEGLAYSSSTDAVESTITLVGATLADVTLADGFITVA